VPELTQPMSPTFLSVSEFWLTFEERPYLGTSTTRAGILARLDTRTTRQGAGLKQSHFGSVRVAIIKYRAPLRRPDCSLVAGYVGFPLDGRLQVAAEADAHRVE
jgi:hypothetical protein